MSSATSIVLFLLVFLTVVETVVHLLGHGCSLTSNSANRCGTNARCTPVPMCSNYTGFGVCWCLSPLFAQPAALPIYQRRILREKMNGTSFWTDCLPVLQYGDSCIFGDFSQVLVPYTKCTRDGIVQCWFRYKYSQGRCIKDDNGEKTIGQECSRDSECDETKFLKCLPNNSTAAFDAGDRQLRCGCVTGQWRHGHCHQASLGDECQRDSECNNHDFDYETSPFRCRPLQTQPNRTACTCGSYIQFYNPVPFVKPTVTVVTNVTSITQDHIWTRTVNIPMLLEDENVDPQAQVGKWCVDIGKCSLNRDWFKNKM